MTGNCTSVSAMSESACGNPASARRAMCEHEHLREGLICDRCMKVSWCKPCYYHPVSPHRCEIQFEAAP